MNEKNLGIVLSIIGGSIGFVGLLTGGFIGLIFTSIIYYCVVGFMLTEFTDFSDNPLTWLFDLLDIKIFK